MPRQRQDRGFALLITIVLLAFLVLLLVTLAGTTRVETQLTNNSLQLTQARSNALMALNVAIGQLQLYAGPDQRVTTTANFGTGATSGSSGVVTPVQGSKQWVGVWGNSQPANNIYAANPSPVFLNWLVSGNEPTSSSTIPTVSTDGHITSSAATPTYLPSTAVSGLTATSTATSTGITIGNSTAILLVGNTTAGSTTLSTALIGNSTTLSPLDRYVVAPLVAIQSSSTPGVTGNATVGHYAWWVGDEGVKAQYNLRDKLDLTDDDVATTAVGNSTVTSTYAPLYQLSVPGRDAFELLTILKSSYPINDTELDDALTIGQFPYLPKTTTTITTYLTAMSDFVTAGSYGLLTNSQSGGLRTDLTQLFNQPTLPTAYKGQPIIGTVVTGNATTATPIDGSSLSPTLPDATSGNQTLAPVAGATWDALKSYYTLSQSVGVPGGSTAVPIRAAVAGNSTTAAVVGVSPVIVQSRLMFTLRCAYQGSAGTTYTPTGGLEWYIQTQPVFVIGNPYPFPITASSGVEFSYGITTSLPLNSEWGLHVAGYQAGTNGSGQTAATTEINRFNTSKFEYQGGSTGIVYYPLLANIKQNGATSVPGILNGLRFATPAFTLQPGQCLTFTLAATTSTASVPSSPLQLQSSTTGVTTNYYEYDTGAASQLNAWINTSTHSNLFVQLLGAEGMTLQMAMPGSPACDGTLSQPQTGALQDVVNADLSANNASYGTNNHDYYRAPPFPGGMDTLQSDNLNGNSGTPVVANYLVFVAPFSGNSTMPAATTDNALFSPQGVAVGGYAMWLSLPLSDTTLYPYDAPTLNLTGAFRTYADYNIAATNFAMPPVAPLISTYSVGNASTTNTFETVPPYARKYLRGPAASSGGVDNTIYTPPTASGVSSPVWGTTTLSAGGVGMGNVTLYDVPHTGTDGQAALFSIGQLQHADLTGDDDFTSVSYQPHYAVGNSYPSPFVFGNTSVQSFTRQAPARVGTTDDVASSGTVRMFDLSYLLNTALWDGFFFSTLQQSGSLVGQPANQRLVFNAGITPTTTQLGINGNGAGNSSVADPLISGSTMPAEKAAARYLMVKGSFNINSTSVQAWEAVLAGANSLTFNGNSTGVPFARSLDQPGGSTTATYGGTDSTTYNGYRRLTTNQIGTLATNIVAQIRARGPFLSLAQFVNRALGTGTTATEGALQAAIDATAVNPFTGVTNSYVGTTAKFFSTPYANTAYNSGLGSTSTAAPGWLTQADILQSIGPVLSARSDTFTVRAYGEVVNPVTQQVTGRAWCEAVVQRFPDYTDPTISPAADPNAQTTTRNFGRKFRIVSFRWLSPNDI